MLTINATVIIAILLIALFALALITGRRFGILGLGIAAGTLLATQTLVPLETIFQLLQEFLGGISPTQAATILLLLAPSIILMFANGPKYGSLKGRIFGSLLYVVMAAFAILPFVMSLMEIPNEVKNVIMTSHTIALVIGVVVAIIDYISGSSKK